MVLRTLINFSAAKRIPLIKFRKGGNQAAGGNQTAGATAAAANQASSKPAAPAHKGAQSTAIEDWELPERYWRKPIDRAEMDYINNGGPI